MSCDVPGSDTAALKRFLIACRNSLSGNEVGRSLAAARDLSKTSLTNGCTRVGTYEGWHLNMNANLQDYRRAARSLLRGRGFSFAVLLALGLFAGTVAVVSQVSHAVLRPVAHALGISTPHRCLPDADPT